MTKKFYEKTGMYIDWQQLSSLPQIDTLIDIGVGPNGAKDFYNYFKNSKLILIDPLDEAKKYAQEVSKTRELEFYQVALGKDDNKQLEMKLQRKRGYSSLLEISSINMKCDYDKIIKLQLKKLDTVLKDKKSLGRIGIKVDTEGYEYDVIVGACETLKYTKFVIAEVRHNHESLEGVYKLQDIMNLMNKNNFILTKIITAKPFIADLCFQPIEDIF